MVVTERRRKGQKAPRQCALYRFYNDREELLYVGVAVDPRARLRQHEIEESWWSEVATIRIEHAASVLEALHNEQLAIANEKPKYNVVLRVGYALTAAG